MAWKRVPFWRESTSADKFSSQRASNSELSCFLVSPSKLLNKQLIWDATTLRWHHCNVLNLGPNASINFVFYSELCFLRFQVCNRASVKTVVPVETRAFPLSVPAHLSTTGPSVNHVNTRAYHLQYVTCHGIFFQFRLLINKIMCDITEFELSFCKGGSQIKHPIVVDGGSFPNINSMFYAYIMQLWNRNHNIKIWMGYRLTYFYATHF